jgi:hypothetical protein
MRCWLKKKALQPKAKSGSLPSLPEPVGASGRLGAMRFRERYNYQVMLDLDRQKNEPSPLPSINHVVGMLEKAVTVKARFVKALAIRKAGEWTPEIVNNSQYVGPLRKQMEDTIGNVKSLTIEQKQKA